MDIHLIDGTYELFRHFYGLKRLEKDNVVMPPLGAVRGVLATVLGMLAEGATHIGVATDHVIESFRNRLWAEYKTGAGIDPMLFAQFHPLEEALESMGVVVWPMVEFEADDALAAAAARAAADPTVDRVIICTPDKDLAQCVVGKRVLQLDRRAGVVRDAEAVREKFGVPPASSADYLALVGDSADGFPGLPGWGARSAATVLARYGRIEDIPVSVKSWDVSVRNAATLSSSLQADRERAMLFKTLATLRTDAPTFGVVDELRWRGPRDDFAEMAPRIGGADMMDRARALANQPVRSAPPPA
jgi:5'-3' exonuclease